MNTIITRREMLRRLTATMVAAAARPVFGAETASRKRLGVCSYSYNLHWKAVRDQHPNLPFKDTLDFIEYCHRLGAGGVQVAIGSKEPGYSAKVRAKSEQYEMYLEGQVSLPKETSDLERFEADLRSSKEAGANVLRAALLSGRRYETFE